MFKTLKIWSKPLISGVWSLALRQKGAIPRCNNKWYRLMENSLLYNCVLFSFVRISVGTFHLPYLSLWSHISIFSWFSWSAPWRRWCPRTDGFQSWQHTVQRMYMWSYCWVLEYINVPIGSFEMALFARDPEGDKRLQVSLCGRISCENYGDHFLKVWVFRLVLF